MTTTGERPSADEAAKLARVVTVPNAISVVRLLLVPVFVWLLFGRDNEVGAAVLLSFLGATDWVDGFVARRFDQVTTLGKILDPVADRLLLIVGGISILAAGAVPAVIAIPMLAREILVAGGVLVLTAMGAKRIDVTFVGKAAAFALMVSLPLFLAAHDEGFDYADPARVLAWIAGVIGVVCGWYSAAQYVPVARQALAEGKAEKAQGGRS